MTDVSKMTDAELEAAHPTYRHASRYGDITVTLTHDPAAKPPVAACASARADKLTVNGVDYRASASMTYSPSLSRASMSSLRPSPSPPTA